MKRKSIEQRIFDKRYPVLIGARKRSKPCACIRFYFADGLNRNVFRQQNIQPVLKVFWYDRFLNIRMKKLSFRKQIMNEIRFMV